jgi:hypothetical protein
MPRVVVGVVRKKEEKTMSRVAVGVALTPWQRCHDLSLVGRMHRPTPTARDVPKAAIGVAFPSPRASLCRQPFRRADLEDHMPIDNPDFWPWVYEKIVGAARHSHSAVSSLKQII